MKKLSLLPLVLALQLVPKPQPVQANPAMAVPAIAACAASVVCAVGASVLGAGGVTYVIIRWQGSQPQYVPVSGGHLADPEQEPITEYLPGYLDRGQAENQCSHLMDSYGAAQYRVQKGLRGWICELYF